VDELIIILALTVVSGVFAGAEIAVIALRKSRLREMLDDRVPGSGALATLREDPERFLATVQVGITVIGATAAALGGASFADQISPWLKRFGWLAGHADEIALALVVVAVSFLSIVIGELVPKSLALRSAERYALLVAKPLLWLSWLTRPMVWVLSSSANLLLKPFGDSTTFSEARHSSEELQQLVEEAVKAGSIHPEAGEIAARALELPELRASDVMVPRQEVIMIAHDAGIEQLLGIAEQHAFNRIPVYRDRIDNVIGYINMKELLPRVLGRDSLHISEVLRSAFFVPEVKQAVELLREMRQRHLPFAIVVDEQGGFSGIVTIEDLIEELVGDIFSEHARQVPQLVRKEADGAALVNGTAPIRHVNRLLGAELPEEGDYTTVAGLSLALAGKVPSVGEVLELPNGGTLEMIDVSPRRVRCVRVRPPQVGREAMEAKAESA
jgi:magnesium and cobalt exporter, CNNM family